MKIQTKQTIETQMISKKNFIIQLLNLLFIPLLSFNFLCADSENLASPKSLKINIISQLNGKGLEADQQLLAEAIEKLGHSVRKLNFGDTEKSRADINIFFETLIPAKFPWATFNWFIPNPEWYAQDIQLLDKVDLILCRTQEVERIFKNLQQPTYYLGFTSVDCYRKEINKDYSHCLHLAGGSMLKGTTALQHVWFSQINFPLLTIISYPNHFVSKQSNLEWIPYRLPVEQLRLLQNQCGIHLCPSETEGFGHVLMEAMSTGAVVVTTDAPPMNEFIQDPRCLVPYGSSHTFCLGTCYHVNSVSLADKIKALLNLPPEELQSIGLNNRALYLKRKQEFHERLEELLWLISSSLGNE